MSSTAAGAAQPRPSTTPRKLRVYRGAVLALALFLFMVGEGTLSRARRAMTTIGHDAAPSIIAAQEIASALADLDCSAANYLVGTADHRKEALRAFESRRVQASQRLVDVAQNITYGDAEKQPISTMVEELGRYLELYGEARFRNDVGDVAGAIETYRVASAVMHERILVAANQLDRANRGYMDSVYDEQTHASSGAEELAVLFGGGLILILVVLQIFVLRTMRRAFNPALVAATVLAVWFTIYLVNAFGDARSDLRVAKLDAFESIHLMWMARAVAYDANGAESRYLLDRRNAPIHEQAFLDAVGKLTTEPTRDWTPTFRKESGAVRGLFADELANVVFPGELEAARGMVRSFNEYYAIDRRIRELERSGKHDAAVQLCLGTAAFESNAVFDAFDRELMTVVNINKKEFDQVVQAGDGALKRAELIDPAVAIAIALLTWFGVRPRLREYVA